jgi:tight adherence protein B
MRRLLVAGLLAASLAPTTAWAQADPDEALVIEDVDTSRHPEVSMVVAMPGSLSGDPVSADAFTVTENGAPRPVTVTPLEGDDLSVVLVLDASGSMSGEPVEALRGAALGFVEALPPGVRTAVVSFADAPTVLSEFSADPADTASAIERLDVAGETALYDGIGVATDLFGATEGRRILVLLSDGGDTVSERTLTEASTAVRDAGATFYAIELRSPESDNTALATLTRTAGGSLAAATDPGALTGMFSDVAAQITNRYQVEYTSEASGPASVAVSVDVDGETITAQRRVRYPSAPRVEPVDTAPAEVPATPPLDTREGFLPSLGFLESTNGLLLGLGAVFLGIAGLVLFTGVGDRSTPQVLRSKVEAAAATKPKTGALTALATEATKLAERSLHRRPDREGALARLMEKAGVWLRPGELVVIATGLALGGAALGLVLIGPAAGLLLGVLALVGVRLWLKRKVSKRQAAFADQLPDALQLLAGGIRAGFGLMQAIDNVAGELPAPAGEEFQRVRVESHLGRDTNEALRAMALRVGSVDFEWVVEAIEINREVGGDLGEILDSVGGTIRDRTRIRRRIKSLSAEGRVSAVILGVLPIALAGIIMMINPSYLGELTASLPGKVMIVGGVIAMFCGIFWMREITKPKF